MKISNKKKNKKTVIAFTIGVVIILAAIIVGYSIRFSYQKSQTVWQDLLSRAGYGKSDTNANSETVFLGDSITFQEDWNVLFGVSDIANDGISGNITDDVLARLDAVIRAKPQKLFLMIGINDLLRGEDVPYIFTNYEKIISEIRLKSPDTTIYIQSVLPVDNDISGSRFGTVDSQKIINLNSKIKSLVDGSRIFFIDLYPYFCGADNKLYAGYAKDGLHLNSHGYAVWKNLIVAYVK
jgi:lysophospholipase L1-like esterase